MKVTILGTAAAEGVPALFCNCNICKKSRQAGGRNIRSRSSILIDDILKIDFPPDTFYHSICHDIDTSKLLYLLITHSHHDHFAHECLQYLGPGFTAREGLPELQIFANKDVISIIQTLENLPLNCNPIVPFKSYNVGEYKITTLKAQHGVDVTPLNYIIEKNEKSILYTCDTGYYDDETWRFLSKYKVDMVIAECTGGPDRINHKYHMGLPNVCEFRKKSEAIGLTHSKVSWILTHFTHNCGVIHDEMIKIATEQRFEVGYDGMILDL